MSRQVVVINAARLLDSVAGEDARVRVSRLATGLLSVASGCSISIELGSEATVGAPLVRFAVEGPDDSDLSERFARELASELDFAFVTEEPRTDIRAPETARWSFESDSGRPIGFASVTPAPGERVIAWTSANSGVEYSRLSAQWLTLSQQYPGLVLSITGRLESGTYRVEPMVRFAGGVLPLRARSLARRLLPGLRIAASPNGPPLTLTVAEPDAAAVLQVPVAAGAPLAGLPVAQSQVIPLLPMIAPGSADGIRLGSAVLPSGSSADVRLTLHEAVRHTHVVGTTGTGKSTLLASMMYDLAARGSGYLLIDPHGSLRERVLAELPRSARDRVWVIECGDLDNVTPMNPFHLDDPVQLDIVTQDMVKVFYRLFDPKATGIVGPRFEGMFTNAMRGLHDLVGRRASIVDVPRVYRDRKLEKQVARAVSEPTLADFWRREMPTMNDHTRSETIGWFASKFDRFTNTAAMRAILGTGADAFDPATAMDERRIIIMDLSKGTIGEVAADLIGFMALTRFWTGFLTRRSSEEYGIFVDEAHSFSAGSLPSMLAEGRKFGAMVTIAHQYLSQLDAPLLDGLDGTVATTIAFRTGANDATDIARRFGGAVPPGIISTQPDLHAVIARSSGPGSPRPHTLVVDHNERVVPRVGAELERFVADIRRQTHRALVDPFRSLTAFDPVAAERAYLERIARPKVAEQSFLDEWLRNRRPHSDSNEASS